MKTDFFSVLPTNSMLPSVDQIDGPKSALLLSEITKYRMRCQQGGGVVKFWNRMIGGEVVSPRKGQDVIKMRAKIFIDF